MTTLRRLLATLLIAGAFSAPAAADVLVKTGAFTKTSGTGNKAVTGVGFQPKALILWGDRQAATGTTDTGWFSIGVTNCTISVSQGSGIGDDLATQDYTSVQSNSNVYRANSLNDITVGDQADLTSCDSDGFTLNWTTSPALLIHYIAFGGSDLTAHVGSYTPTSSATPVSQSITGVGFSPTLIFTLSAWTTATTTADGAKMPAYGWTDCTRGNASFVVGVDASNPSVARRWQRTDRMSGVGKFSDGTLLSAASITSCDSDGWTMNWETPNDAGGNGNQYLALGGIQAYVGNALQPTATGNQDLSTPGMTPQLVVLQSVGNTATASVATESRLSLGAADATSQGYVWIGENDNVSASQSARENNTSALIRMGTPAATGSSSTTEATAAFSSFSSGKATINWTTADATQREFVYVAFGGAIPDPTERLSPFLIAP